MLARQTRTLFKVRASRSVRGALKGIKRKISGSNEGTPDSIFGEIITKDSGNKEHKYKSTLAVAVAGTAMGVSHVAAVSGKYSKKVSGKGTLGVGLAVGAVTAGIWYRYIDAANDGISEDDISMMFEMVNNTGFGSIDDDGDSAKAIDILHTVVTGKVDDEASSGKSESLFKYDDEDDKGDEDDDEDANLFTQKASFSDSKSTSAPTVKKFGSTGIGKSIGGSTFRKSLIPDLDKQDAEAERAEKGDGWLDLS